MKFILIALCAALLSVNSLQAQHMNIGVKGGLNLYNIVNENGNYGDVIPGFHLGLLAHIHLSEQFALQPEVVFSTQGARNTSVGIQSSLNLSYVNVPILVQYMFDNGFRLFAGPQIGFLVLAKTNLDNSEIDRMNDFNSFELGASFGASYINPNSNFGIDARYNLGLTNINEQNSDDYYNRGFQVGLFYLFKHK